MLQVLIVGGDDTKGTFLVEDLQHRFRHCPTNLGFCTSTKLINEDEALPVAMLHHVLHVEQMGRIGGKVILQTLFVADVDEDAAEDAEHAALGNRDGHSALEHILQQACGLQADRLATCIRS